MDPAAADPPCIIQALPANAPPSTTHPPPVLVQALPAPLHHCPAKAHPPAATAAAASASRPPRSRPQPPPTSPPPPPGPIPPSPRRTRSGGAPEWTRAETLALVAEVAAVDDGWSRSVSAFQKWAMVAENLAASEAFASGPAARRRGTSKRAAAECRRRWEALAAEYGAVRRCEVRTGASYWEMGAAARRKAGLPAEFDAEVYGAMDALIRVEEALLAGAAGGGGAATAEEVEGLVGGGGGVEVGEEEDGGEDGVGEDEVQEDGSADEEEEEDGRDDEEEMQQPDAANADASTELGEASEAETNNKPENSQNVAWELANKLQENAQHIHSILDEEAGEYAEQSHAFAYSMSADAMETTRQKADELIKSLGGLVGFLNQFTDLIKETGFENIGMT
ncbi:hypothetical protein EJB05_24553, partial [Eragrostis curvula]